MEILNENKLSILRRYFFESVLLALVFCVVTLFYMYSDLNRYIRTTLTDQSLTLQLTIKENTRVMNEIILLNKNK